VFQNTLPVVLSSPAPESPPPGCQPACQPRPPPGHDSLTQQQPPVQKHRQAEKTFFPPHPHSPKGTPQESTLNEFTKLAFHSARNTRTEQSLQSTEDSQKSVLIKIREFNTPFLKSSRPQPKPNPEISPFFS
jgi:hypothetical protein